ncbi:NAD-dependent epimerase/dehydratase family protein [Frigidibacter sp. ROC022]|uniref:NAD-dependent epimerase/dehydratase family protein n=1 Tax=Frigidibacter sp. ROC022 TaxID=2971796 RepID=UPI00215A20E8|nr:NAD-dependent epimerase/dehydratase family protein [Frigidibacter sp. ROC022]MCR8724836.1 NAD-dependent epimerase/dehydratase family protein [Frigidibacter sp. ROC022]
MSKSTEIQNSDPRGTIVVAGASGGAGRRVVEAFRAAGWEVRVYRRGTDLGEFARGADVIFNGMNPPMYHNWRELIPAITRQVIAAARVSGATILMPGNLYVYGDQPGPWADDTPHRPCSRKGEIRAEMERSYRAAADEGVRTIILRGGDFIDPANPDTLLNMLVLKKLKAGKITAMGRAEARRSYAYLPDMARAFVALAERRDSLPAFTALNMAGPRFSYTELAAMLSARLGRRIRIGRFPWWLMRLASPVWELARELCEMRYLHDLDHEIDGSGFERLVPGFEATPLDAVIEAHLPEEVRATMLAGGHPAQAAS